MHQRGLYEHQEHCMILNDYINTKDNASSLYMWLLMFKNKYVNIVYSLTNYHRFSGDVDKIEFIDIREDKSNKFCYTYNNKLIETFCQKSHGSNNYCVI